MLEATPPGCRDEQILPSSIYSQRADGASELGDDLRAAPEGQRPGEFLGRTISGKLAGLEECAQVVNQQLAPELLGHYRKS